MNAAKSWACYLWLLTIESWEQLLDFASIRNPISRRGMRLTGYVWSEKENSQLPAASGGR